MISNFAMVASDDAMVESPTLNRRQPLLSGNFATRGDGNGRRIGEVAGGTAAECAVVCCCFPCTLMHLIVTAFYKVPTGLCKKALRKTKRRKLTRKKKKDLPERKMNGPDAVNAAGGGVGDDSTGGEGAAVGVMDDVDLDSEMWDRFYGAGFWRSFSRREE